MTHLHLELWHRKKEDFILIFSEAGQNIIETEMDLDFTVWADYNQCSHMVEPCQIDENFLTLTTPAS